MSVTDGDRVIAPGVPLELNDGTTVRVRFGYKQLQRLEKRFGSLQALFTGMEAGMSGEFFGSFFPALAIGCNKSEDELSDLIEPGNAATHMQVLGEALEQAFPKEARAAATKTTSQSQTGESTGSTATSLPPSSTGEATMSLAV
jgi:hypothetical protein